MTQLSRGNEPTASSPTISVLQVLGTEDATIPYGGGPGPMGLDFHPAEDSAAIWAAHNGCESGGTRSTTASGNIRIEYTACRAAARVTHYGIVGAGHALPRDTEGRGVVDLAFSFFEATP